MLLKQKSKGGTFVNYEAYFFELSNTHCFKGQTPTMAKPIKFVSLNREQQLESVYFKSVLYCVPDLHIFYMLAIAQ